MGKKAKTKRGAGAAGVTPGRAADATFPLHEHHQCGGSYEEWTTYCVELRVWWPERRWALDGTVQDGVSGGDAGAPRAYAAAGEVREPSVSAAAAAGAAPGEVREPGGSPRDTSSVELTLAETAPAAHQGYYPLGRFAMRTGGGETRVAVDAAGTLTFAGARQKRAGAAGGQALHERALAELGGQQ